MAELRASEDPPVPRLTKRQALALSAVLVAYLVAALWRIGTVGLNGYGNFYYAAAVQSMLRSWHNLFYLSFDPSGFLALDKPPLAHWLQALSAWVFGFRGWALLMPQVVSGLLSILLLWHLVRRASGNWAGIIAALLLALTPISVLAARNNTAESHLVLVMLLAAWCVMLSVERGSLRHLLLAGALVGIGFNVKMLQIGLAAPGLALLYLAASRLPWRQRIRDGILACLIALLVASPWVLAVELTPAANRPYVDGSPRNSPIELALGYNGAARLWGEDWTAVLGAPGPLRLLNDLLGGQASWFLPLALIGLILGAVRWARGELSAGERRAVLLWAGWISLQLIYFSVSTFYHRYYLSVLAPGLAALAAMGLAWLWRLGRQGGRWRWLAAGAYALCLAGQATIIWPHVEDVPYLIPICAVLALGGGLALFLRRRASWLPSLGAATIALSLLLGPIIWIAIPLTACPYSNAAVTMPAAGPRDDCQPGEARPWIEPALVEYLRANRQGAAYLGASYDLGISGLAILATGEPFLTLGGYRGNMPILTVDEFADLVREGEVRFFLALSPDPEHEMQRPIREWVADHCPRGPDLQQGVLLYGPCTAGE